MKALLDLKQILFLMIVSSLFPLVTYIISLSLFGVPHIYSELYYIKNRFAGQFPKQFVLLIFLTLGCLCILKMVSLFFELHDIVLYELCLGSILIAIALIMFPHPGLLVVLAGFVLLLIYSPIILFLLIAFTHNLTPVGFFQIEKIKKRVWINFFFAPIGVFIIAFILSIFFNTSFSFDANMFPNHLTQLILGHYLSQTWMTHATSSVYLSVVIRAMFSMAVFYQLMHYDSTIRVLPSTINQKPLNKLFGVTSFLFFVVGIVFFISFYQMKAVYNIISAFHAWLEIPLLLVLFSLGFNKRALTGMILK